MILAIETSSTICSVALCSNHEIIKEYESNAPMQHASLIGTYVDNILKETKADIHLVAVAIGPGSFTGLRIGLSYAQGFCFGRQIPIVGVTNHQILAAQLPGPKSDIFSIIDANREELYFAEHANDEIFKIKSHKIITLEKLLDETSPDTNISCVESLKLPQKIESERKINRVHYKASFVAQLGNVIFKVRGPDDIEKLEPMYIRPFAGVQ